MPLVTKQIEEVKHDVIDPVIKSISSHEKFDVIFVIMIVLLLFAFKNVTAFIIKTLGIVFVMAGLYTLFL